MLSVVIDLVWELCCCWPCIVVQAEAALEEKRAVFDESDTDMLQQDQAEVQRLQARLTCVTAHYHCMHLRLTALRGLYQSRIDSHASLSNVVSPVYTVYNYICNDLIDFLMNFSMCPAYKYYIFGTGPRYFPKDIEITL